MERGTVRAVRQALETLDMTEIEQRFNVKIALKGGGRYDPSEHGSATFKIEATPVVNGEAKDRETLNFERYAQSYGLLPTDLGREFLAFDGNRYKITGLNTRARKNPIVAKSVKSGKTYVFPAHSVSRALKMGD